jgi:hypothetical protein
VVIGLVNHYAFAQVSPVFAEVAEVRVSSYCLHRITAIQGYMSMTASAGTPHIRAMVQALGAPFGLRTTC